MMFNIDVLIRMFQKKSVKRMVCRECPRKMQRSGQNEILKTKMRFLKMGILGQGGIV